MRQRGRPGLLTVYSGGRRGAGYTARARTHLRRPRSSAIRRRQISRAVPGLPPATTAAPGWTTGSDPWTHGSYAAFRPGQFTRYWGFVGMPEGGCHFGGEHTAMAAQGFLEGAVRSGERCAREVSARVRGRS